MAQMHMNDSRRSMATDIESGSFKEWPEALRALFDGSAIENKTGFTASLLAVDQHCVRTSLLSVGELYAPDGRSLLIALWPSSRVAKAVSKTGFATLSFVFDHAYFQVQFEVRSVAGAGPSSLFVATLQFGEWQKVGYARLKHGIEFDFAPEREQATLERWRKQIEVLKQSATQ